jgi:hypothetical protein
VIGLGSLSGEPTMQKPLIAAILLVSLAVSALAAETFYIIFDATLHGCTIETAEPTDMSHYKVLGTYKSEAEAQKAIASKKEC